MLGVVGAGMTNGFPSSMLSFSPLSFIARAHVMFASSLDQQSSLRALRALMGFNEAEMVETEKSTSSVVMVVIAAESHSGRPAFYRINLIDFRASVANSISLNAFVHEYFHSV